MKSELELAFETTKQFITLATGILMLTVTFADKFKLPDSGLTVPSALKLAWVSFAVVIFFGAWTLMAITGSASGAGTNGASGPNVRIPAVIMVLAFAVGVLLTVVAGFEVVN